MDVVRYVDYCCSFGCSTPGSAPALSVQHSRSWLPVTGNPLHITHCLFLMLVTSRCRGVRMGPNTLHSRIKERKLPLNSRHESFEEERDLPIFPGLAAYRNFRPITRG